MYLIITAVLIYTHIGAFIAGAWDGSVQGEIAQGMAETQSRPVRFAWALMVSLAWLPYGVFLGGVLLYAKAWPTRGTRRRG